MKGSEYVEGQRREYALYVLSSRAICAITDGLKHSGRRIMWMARDGKKYKTATLAGATMPIHPHAEASGAINTLAAPYGNNVPLLAGDGAFGTLLNPTAYGAARYTSVKVSQFAKDAFYTDIELVPMQENYDGTLEEPVHFLPLVPICLLNPSEGIAVGFASTILPRALENIIEDQIKHLQDKRFIERPAYFAPTDQRSIKDEKDRWLFTGSYEQINTTTLRITKLPYGIDHKKYVDYLMKLEEDGKILDFQDNSKDVYDIVIKFKRGVIATLLEKKKLFSFLKLSVAVSENMNVLDFDGQYILNGSYTQIIEDFTDWRLSWYKKRYQRLAKLLKIDIQKYLDVLTAIENNVGGDARLVESRTALKERMKPLGIVHLDYIADLSIYRFTESEKIKVEKKLEDARALLAEYENLISNQKERVKVYINELKTIQKNYVKGLYVTTQ